MKKAKVSLEEMSKGHEKYIESLGGKIWDNEVAVKACALCNHQKDSHMMNCVECCHITRAREKLYEQAKELLGIKGTVYENLFRVLFDVIERDRNGKQHKKQ